MMVQSLTALKTLHLLKKSTLKTPLKLEDVSPAKTRAFGH